MACSFGQILTLVPFDSACEFSASQVHTSGQEVRHLPIFAVQSMFISESTGILPSRISVGELSDLVLPSPPSSKTLPTAPPWVQTEHIVIHNRSSTTPMRHCILPFLLKIRCGVGVIVPPAIPRDLTRRLESQNGFAVQVVGFSELLGCWNSAVSRARVFCSSITDAGANEIFDD